ncbi:hemagglutinin repeat-containing protein [Variovorax saccharolyticus]|uniref:hemagglutinin repeat-containing protein n=1 Tax=Variovorax saccharolyticus TaxID=3053516 RepID=UPI00257533BB|nr:hemagglutinin repeat-containing protein [Variovorax sp. J31P216]MDM0030084.1 hemagglutinin repeat-containing protein [Variovorax sp. J31P216]
MNKLRYRVIFSVARGMLIAVQETARSAGKAAGTTAGVVGAVGVTTAALLAASPALAQIAGDPSAPGNQRPTVLAAPNGVPIVNIVTPSAAGVSRNVYRQFDVNAQGVILNNSRTAVPSKLGGNIAANPWLATGPARVILNEVNSSSPSYLRGYVEVAGPKADVIIANPSGIQVQGGGFINSNRVTLTTGGPQLNAYGGIESYRVTGGSIGVSGNGVDFSGTEFAALYARMVEINGGVWGGGELRVVTGANQIGADGAPGVAANVVPIAGAGPAQPLAFDAGALGGMYAQKIWIMGSEAGVGARNAGTLQTGAGDAKLMGLGELTVTSAGRIENIGTIQAAGDAVITAPTVANSGKVVAAGSAKVTVQGDLTNAGTIEGQRIQLASAAGDVNNSGTIRQTSMVGLTLAAPTLINTNGASIGSEPVADSSGAGAGGEGSGSGGSGAASGGNSGDGASAGSTEPSTSGGSSTGTVAGTAPAPIAPGSITAAGTIRNDGGHVYAGGPIELQTPNVMNAGGKLEVNSLAVSGPAFSNARGVLNVANGFSANVDSFDNQNGKVTAGSVSIATTGDLLNDDGSIASNADVGLQVGGMMSNQRGTVSATGALDARVAGAIQNASGSLIANQAVTVQGRSLDNTQGTVASAAAGTSLSIADALTNSGQINAATDLAVHAGSMSNSGTMRGGNDASITVANALSNDGSITAARNTSVAAASLQGGGTSVLGAGINADGSLGATGDLNVTATGALVAKGTNLAAGDASLQGASVDLSGSQTGAANIAITAIQGDVTTSGATVATAGTLGIHADSQGTQTLVSQGGKLNAGQSDLHASNIDNTNDGEIVQTGTGATTIAVTGSLNNAGGRIASNSQDLTLRAANLTNTAGKVEHAGTGPLNIEANSVDGANGQITSNGAFVAAVTGDFNQDGGTTTAKRITIDAGSLGNRGGTIVQTGTDATRIAVVGALDNGDGGSVASNGATTIAAGSLVNQAGSIRAAGTSDLSISTAGLLDNSAQGEIGAGGNVALSAGSLANDAGRVTAVGSLTVTTVGAASNVGGTLAANNDTTISAASLDSTRGTIAAVNGDLAVTTTGATQNSIGTVQAGGNVAINNGGFENSAGKVFGNALAIDTHGNALTNAQGTLAATTTVALNSGALANDAGLIQSGGAMTVDTNGQALSNTNAAGYAGGQGGITSTSTLDITSGALNNASGYIGSKGALTADTAGVENTGGGVVFSQSSVAVDTHGATYNNTGGQTQAVGDVTVDAGTVQNAGGLFRSGATTTLNAGTIVNTGTLGADQGIEGQNVALNVGNFNNTQGAVRSDVNTTITSGGSVDNTNGLISAGDTLRIVDPNAANPAAKTLGVVNTGGNLAANKSLQLDAARFSADGTVASGQDLSIALTQDIVNNGEVSANGDLTYVTTGNLTNNGKLLAGGTLTAGGNIVENTTDAEMSGANTVVQAGTLNNRGIIDSNGQTRIDANIVNNLGTGRVYGDAVSIGAATVNNDTEVVNGATSSGTIAGRKQLDIGASVINNREHALIFSGGDMTIGGTLDAGRRAVGQATELNNLSATIESLDNMSISAAQINNYDTHIQQGSPVTTVTGPVASIGIEGVGFFTPDQVITTPGSPIVYARNPDGSQGAILSYTGWGMWYTTTTVTEDTAVNADPARIVSGGDMTLTGSVHNKSSQIIAGGTLMSSPVNNEGLKGNRTSSTSALVYDYTGQFQGPVSTLPQSGTIDVALYEPVQHLKDNKGDAPAAAGGVNGPGGSAGGIGGVGGGGGPGAVIEVASAVKGSNSATGNSAGAADPTGANGATSGSRDVAMVVRTSTPDTRVPTASLFQTKPGAGSFLIETDPRFANYRNWLGSDYLLNALGYDPNSVQKRLGDGFYEQKLIREQVAQLTGYRYLSGYASDEEQYTALMNAGVTFAQQYQLTPGAALTAAQMAQLTSDIVWLVSQTVTLPDGTTQSVLVPQVYVRVRPGDIDGSGALLSANATVIQGAGDLVNTGTIAGRTVVSINADNVNNLLGGRIAGGSVGINATNDINNIGASITADNAAVLNAGRDINVRSTTKTTTDGTHTGSNLDQIAGLYVSNPDGVLIASAGRDVNLIGAAMVSGGALAVGAGRNINLGTVTEASTAVGSNAVGAGIATQSREIGSAIVGGSDVRLAAGNDLNIRAGAVASANGALVATAANDINISAGQATSSVATASVQSSGGLLKKTTTSTFDSTSTTEVLSSTLSGNTVALVAGNDITAQAAQIQSSGATSMYAGRDIKFTTANQTTEEAHASQTKTSATGLGHALGASLAATGGVVETVGGAALMGGRSATGTESSTRTDAIGTTVSAGSLQMVSGRDTTLQAATVVADGNITMVAGRNLTIESAQNTHTSASSNAQSKSGSIGTWYNPSIGNVKNSEANAGTGTSQTSSQVASLAGNVTLVAGETYRQTASSVLAAGLAGPLVGGDVTILAKNVLINEAYNTEQAVGVARGSSTVLGGSASFGGISTDSIRNARNTVDAMGDTNDSRIQALGAVNLAMGGKQAGDTATSLASGGGANYKVSVNLSRNQSQSTSFSNSSEAVGSSIVGSNNVNIISTGGGQDSNIHAIGSTIAAGNTVNLAADNAITLEASRNVRESAGVNSSSGASVGVGFAGGSQNGFTIELSAASGKGSDNQNDVTYNNTRVSGGQAVNIVSGGDLTLKGGVVQGNRVDADVGGNLNIESLQDVSVGQSRQSSSGVNASLCIPPICYGVSTVGGDVASAKANGVFVGVGEQSGIKAGDGGFDVKVKGDTNLVGGVIESTQAAIDAGNNNFKTGGSLTISDLQNQSQASGSSYAVSGNVGVVAGGTSSQQAAMHDKGMSDSQIATASNTSPGGGAGIGSSSSSQGSVTKSGISGIAGDDSVRTGDNSSVGTLIKDWNTQDIIKDVQAQAQITQEFGQKASSAWGQYANSKLVDAVTNNDADAIACWGDGGACRVAGHTVIGGLSGGGAGAAGAGLGSVAVSSVGGAVAGLGLSAAAADAVTAGLSSALGYAVGGASGAAGAYNEAANNYLSSSQVREMMDKLRAAPTQAERDTILKDYATLSAQQSAAIAGCAPATCEQLAVDVQGGKQALNSAQSELKALAGDSSGAAYSSILGTQKTDQQFFYSLGNGWIDSNGQSIDISAQMRASGKNMADTISSGAAYVAAGCVLSVVCIPAIPGITFVGGAAGIAKDWIFDPDPASYVIDGRIDKGLERIGQFLKVPPIITTPIAEGIKNSKELADWKNQFNLKP